VFCSVFGVVLLITQYLNGNSRLAASDVCTALRIIALSFGLFIPRQMNGISSLSSSQRLLIF